ncbi:hypothetical protein [Variovorax sp. J22R115]|uniref:hypothetical protein n=1 Tax=Variovorax sp. J22R115 TaxID=3053509 RepID=UPI002576CEDB|nr:hypothetical protein [Variovorax sp. J22R115]
MAETAQERQKKTDWAIRCNRVLVGMPAADVIRSLGSPARVNHPLVDEEEWTYGLGERKETAILLRGGVVQSIQETLYEKPFRSRAPAM